MNKFNFNRFWNFGRWDMTVNRPFYRKSVMFVFGIIFLPVLVKYFGLLWQRGILMRQPDAFDFSYAQDSVDGMAGTIQVIAAVWFTFFMGYTFHNLLTRQGRINELTLPATNLERFVWHVLLTWVGGALLIAGSVLLADALHVLLGFTVAGQRHFNSLTLSVFRNIVEAENYPLDGGFDAVCFWLLLVLGTLNQLSVFVLGNAVKYRHNIVQTFMVLIAFGLVFSVGAGVTVTIFASQIHIDVLERVVERVDGGLVLSLLVALSAAVLCLIWWLTYRFYCRAQITTSRNP